MNLTIGSDIQCEKCKIWYQPQIEHICKTKDLDAAGFDYYAPSNIKNPKVFSDADEFTRKQVEEILARVERIKANKYLGEDGKYHTNLEGE